MDHLRLVLICGVVIAHVAALYGAGVFYQYHDSVPPDVFTSSVLLIPALIAEMFGMGFFFLLAGYLTPGSYDRKGGAAFLRDRLVRLGIPLVVYDVLLDPLTAYLARGRPGSFWNFYGPYLLQVRTIGPEVAWFILALLLFTLLYAAWRSLIRKRSLTTHRPATLPSTRSILGFIVALGLASFVVRLWWPLRWSGWPTWWLQLLDVKGGLLPQYLSLFVLGCIAYRRNWFTQLTPRMGRNWSLIALLATLFIFGGVLLPSAVQESGAAGTQQAGYAILGGFNWLAFGYALWEAFVVVGVGIGLLVLFRQRWNHQRRVAKSLAASVYTVYLIHPVVLVGFAYAFHVVVLYPLLKWAIAVLITIPLCFLISGLIRRIPLVNRVL
jgi:surface polysaccharide O-acyltransferase-like enzyme